MSLEPWWVGRSLKEMGRRLNKGTYKKGAKVWEDPSDPISNLFTNCDTNLCVRQHLTSFLKSHNYSSTEPTGEGTTIHPASYGRHREDKQIVQDMQLVGIKLGWISGCLPSDPRRDPLCTVYPGGPLSSADPP